MMGFIGKYCPQCGYRFPGQRTGKCPNCDESTLLGESGRLYRIHPGDIKIFDDLNKKGGIIKAMAKGINWPFKKFSAKKI